MKAQCISDFLFKGASKGETRFILSGHSMHPTITHNQIISIRCRPSHLQTGRIYVFLYNNRLVCHRLVKVSKNRAFFSGDNCSHIEEVDTDAVIGIYPRIEPFFVSFGIHLCNILTIVTGKKIFYRIKRKITRRRIYLYEKEVRKTAYS